MSTTEHVTSARLTPPGMESATLCEAFQRSAAEFADRPALRASDGSLELSWGQYAERVARIAAGLAAIGVRRGDTVGMVLLNRPEFHLIDTAVLHLGATPFSVYITSSPEQISYVLGNAGSRVLLVERRFLAQVRAADLPGIEQIIVIDGDGAEGLNLDQLEAGGAPGFDLEAESRAVEPEDLATLVYTSGTTGPPKGVEVTHASLMFTLRSCDARVALRAAGRVVSYLPHAHLADRFVAHYMQLATGACLTTVADPKQIFAALPDCRPTIFLGVPRIWEKLRGALLAGFQDEPPERRAAVERALGFGLRKVRAEQGGDAIDPEVERQWEEANATTFQAIRERIGLDKADWLISGAAPISAAVQEFFFAIGMPICEGWGMSETSALGLLNDPGSIRIGSVGRPIPGTELELAADGEILVRGPHVMRGYRDDPGRTAEAIDSDGWLHTGDIGEVESDGYVRIIDRKKELIISSAGKNMSPANIEAKLKSASPLIGQACCIGDGRPYNVALVVLDPDSAAAYAAEHGLADGSAASLADDERLQAEVASAVERANAQLSRVEQVKRYLLLPVEWLPDGEELTPTMKLKRRAIGERYADVIDRLYAQS